MPRRKTPIENVTSNAVATYEQELKESVENTGYSIATSLGAVGKSTEEQKKEMARLLSEKRNQVNYLLDGAKLNQAMKNMEAITQASEILTDPEVLERVKSSVKSPYDYKQLADAQKTFIKNMQDLNALDTLDEGNSARLSLAVSLKNSDGTSTQVVVQTK